MSITLALLSLTAIVSGFLRPSSKKVTLFQLIYMWLIFAFNTNNADYYNYMGIYSRIGSGTSYTIANYEKGFVFLCSLCNRLGLSYAQFIVLVATGTTILFAIILQLYMHGRKQNIAVSIFIITMYWVMICQYRNYIAILIVMTGLYYYLNNQSKAGVFVFIISVLIAFSFHRSSILFLIFLLIKPLNIRKCFWSIPVAMVPFILLRNGWLNKLVVRYVTSYKITNFLYNGTHRTLAGVTALILLRIILLGIELWVLRNIAKYEADKKKLDFVTSVIKITLLSFAYMSLEAFDPNYERLFRIPLLLSIFAFAEYGGKRSFNIRRVPLQYMSFIGFYGLYMAAFYVSNKSWFYSVLLPVLSNNSLIGT